MQEEKKEKIPTITFNEFIDINDAFGKILIIGLEGFGKTLLLSYIAVEAMLNGRNDCFKSWQVVDRYNKLGFRFSKNYEHLCFTAFITVNCKGTNIPGRKSYDFDPFHFGLYCEDFDTYLYPPYAHLFVPECQRVWPSYKSEYIRAEVYGKMETGRQSKFDLIADAQRLMMIAKPIRDLFGRILILKSKVKHIKNNKGVVIGHLLHIIEFNSNASAESYVNNGQNKDGREYYLKLDRCIFNNYLSDYFEFMSLIGREKQDFRIVEHLDIRSIVDINKMSSILMPEDYLVPRFKKKDKSSIGTDSVDDDIDVDDYMF